MSQRSQSLLEPRKSPVQARSTASVDAILEATVQVLLDLGKERLTTTRVASRAGVSVGTLYQYFPNKSALLQAALKRHLDGVTETVERVCREQKGNSLANMGTALVDAFLRAKMNDGKTSVALYAVSSDVDGARIVARDRTTIQSSDHCHVGECPGAAGQGSATGGVDTAGRHGRDQPEIA